MYSSHSLTTIRTVTILSTGKCISTKNQAFVYKQSGNFEHPYTIQPFLRLYYIVFIKYTITIVGYIILRYIHNKIKDNEMNIINTYQCIYFQPYSKSNLPDNFLPNALTN